MDIYGKALVKLRSRVKRIIIFKIKDSIILTNSYLLWCCGFIMLGLGAHKLGIQPGPGSVCGPVAQSGRALGS